MKLVIVLGLLLCGYTIQAQDKNPGAGEVDSLSAVKIAQQAWLKKFGRMVNLSKPYCATLKNDSVWVVKGTLHTDRGGTPYAMIDRQTGRVLLNTHTK
jgi:NTF2 fold immunity protein of polymorphic toxin system component